MSLVKRPEKLLVKTWPVRRTFRLVVHFCHTLFVGRVWASPENGFLLILVVAIVLNKSSLDEYILHFNGEATPVGLHIKEI